MAEDMTIQDWSLNDFVEELVDYSQCKNEKSPLKKIKELSGRESNKNLARSVIGPLIVLSDSFAPGNEKWKKYVDLFPDPSTREKFGSSEKNNSLIFAMINKACELDWADKSNESSGIRDFLGTTSFTIFRAFIAKWIEKKYADEEIGISSIAGSMTVGDALTIIEKFMEEIKDGDHDPNKEKPGNVPSHSKINEKLLEENFQNYQRAVERILSFEKAEYKGSIFMIDPMTDIENKIKYGAKQIVLTGAPGTGKTRMAKEIAKEKGTVLPWMAEKAEYELVQFHPSYDYTDFIEGLRPVENAGKVEFQKLDGIFKRFCRHVVEQNKPDSKYFFIIDEINRADLSKVFGELMYCLESDKRGEQNRIQTQYQNLTQSYTEREIKGYRKAKSEKYEKEKLSEYIKERGDIFADGFYIPENVIIIGTMNDIDRSVESMDYALRRRFLWKEIEVSEELLKEAFQYQGETTKEMVDNKQVDFVDYFWGKYEKESIAVDKIAKEIAKRVMKMNDVMTNPEYSNFGLNRQYYISQGQFANLPTDITNKLETVSKDNTAEDSKLKEFLEEVFAWRIEPLLREYVRGEDEKTVEDFITDCKKALLKIPDSENNTGADSDSKPSGT